MKKLTRSTSDRKLSGVCGGLGQFLNVDPTLLRLVLVFVGIATGIVPMLIAYVVAWAIVPEEPFVGVHRPATEVPDTPPEAAGDPS